MERGARARVRGQAQGRHLQEVSGVMGRVARMGGGQAQGLPLPLFEGGRRVGRGREFEGRHKAGTYLYLRGGRRGGRGREFEGRHKAGTYLYLRGGE